MEFLDLVKNRYSVRGYQTREVEEEKLNAVLEAARLAPTAANRQPIQIIVVKTKGREEELKRIYPSDWFVQAPIVICVCTIPDEAWVRKDGRNYSDVDGAIVMDHIVMEAQSLGLGTCWMAAFNLEATREILEVPENVLPLLFTPLGYPDAEPRNPGRKSMEEIVKYDKY